MNPNQGREAAYVKSRVKDLSLITNAPDYVALFACITPKANSELENDENVTYIDVNGNPTDDTSEANRVYLPQLVRDVETLDTLFGDPRVDPDTYKDLLAARYIIENGFACYIAKVKSGNPYRCSVSLEGFFDTKYSGDCEYNPQLDDLPQLKTDLENCIIFNAQSSIVGNNSLSLRLIPYKPYNINQVSLEIIFKSKATDLSEEVIVSSTRVSLVPDTRNVDFLKTINSYLGGDLILQLPDTMDDSLYSTPYDAYTVIEGYQCIVNTFLFLAGMYDLNETNSEDPSTSYFILDNMKLVGLNDKNVKNRWLNYYQNTKGEKTFSCATKNGESSVLTVSQSDYTRSLQTYNDPKYSGCFISELASEITNLEDAYKTRYLVKQNLYEYDNTEEEDVDPEDVFPPADYQFATEGDCCANIKQNIFIETYKDKDEDHNTNYYSYEEVKKVCKPYYIIKEIDETTGEKGWVINTETALYNIGNDGDVWRVTPKESEWEDQGFDKDLNPSIEISKATMEEDVETVDGVPVWKHSDTHYYFIKKNPLLEDKKLTSRATDEYPESNVVELKSPLRTKCYPNIEDPSSLDAYKNFTTTQSTTITPFYVEGEVDGKKQFVLGVNKETSEALSTEEHPYPENDLVSLNVLREMPHDQRRGLHYIIKQLAATRKNLTCVFSTPYCPLEEDTDGTYKYNKDNIFDLTTACNWVAARGNFSDLFEYGNSQAVEYPEQAFYCEMYWSWVKWRVTKLVNGLATGSSTVIVPPTPFVILNALASYRAKGSFYPVAGDQGGVLPESCLVLQNPSTKTQRDKLISYRINPIYDTGIRGVQIYGNETLNPQFTDLSAAHIARTLVQIRSKVDAYSETIKFSLNDMFTWGTWTSYVSSKILDPIKSLGGLQWYQVDMGYNTTTRDEMSQRKIRGMISLQFTPDLEIIDLEFVVMASSLELDTNT